jgi:hypothetical protein
MKDNPRDTGTRACTTDTFYNEAAPWTGGELNNHDKYFAKNREEGSTPAHSTKQTCADAMIDSTIPTL